MTFDLQLVYSIISIACSLMASSYKLDLNKTNSPVLLDSPSRGLPETAAGVVSRSRPYFCLHFYKLTSSLGRAACCTPGHEQRGNRRETVSDIGTQKWSCMYRLLEQPGTWHSSQVFICGGMQPHTPHRHMHQTPPPSHASCWSTIFSGLCTSSDTDLL